MSTSQSFQVAPSFEFQGNDGDWSTIAVRIGAAASAISVNVIPSTSQPITYVVYNSTVSCQNLTSTFQDCAAARGGFVSNDPPYKLVGEQTLSGLLPAQQIPAFLSGSSATAAYGYDTLGLSYTGSGLPVVNNQLISLITTDSLFLGVLGIYPHPFELQKGVQPYPSFFTKLFKDGQIASLSWSYTAGARYKSATGVYGSLAFGGYNADQIIASAVTFQMNSNPISYLTVGVHSITISSGQNVLAGTGPINVALDSTLPYFWLPIEACNVFKTAFNLEYDPVANFYTIPHSSWVALNAEQPSIEFVFGPSKDGGDTVTITLPWGAFNLRALPPLANNVSYFPLKQATNPQQYMFGRTFFQEAYLIADFERGNFSVHPINWKSLSAGSGGGFTQINPPAGGSGAGAGTPTPIPNSSSGGSSTPVGAIAGGVVGGIVAILAILALIFWLRRRKRRSGAATELPADEHSLAPPVYSSPHDDGIPMAQRVEMDGKAKRPRELEGAATATTGHDTPTAYSDALPSPGMTHDGASPIREMDANVYYELPGQRHEHGPSPTDAGSGTFFSAASPTAAATDGAHMEVPTSHEALPGGAAGSTTGAMSSNEILSPRPLRHGDVSPANDSGVVSPVSAGDRLDRE